jgi:restriction system protein
MSEKSLFARLLRSPWWVSFATAGVVGAAGFALLPEQFRAAGALSGIPFVVIGLMAAWKQRNTLSPKQLNETLQSLSAMPGRAFIDALAAAYEKDGYVVTRNTTAGADLSITKSGRTALVNCKRWKAAAHSVEPVNELYAAMNAQEIGRGIYVAINAPNDAAATFAAKNGIQWMTGAQLAQLVRASAARK